MLRTLVNMNPAHEVRSMEEIFDQLFGAPVRPNGTPVGTLPLDILESEGVLKIRAAVPGVEPNELEIQIEKNVLTIRGEIRHEEGAKDEKVYRREVSYGSFARSVRLPEGLDFERVDAEFKNGIVTISLPRVPEEKPKAIKVNVRQQEIPAETEN
ncbi:MAG: Hsp20/alpha crystallin family protein [Fimbriimonas sp.]|nr:Hsp20/alpha crystallin family protein [Fimbriimonas sp.]